MRCTPASVSLSRSEVQYRYQLLSLPVVLWMIPGSPQVLTVPEGELGLTGFWYLGGLFAFAGELASERCPQEGSATRARPTTIATMMRSDRPGERRFIFFSISPCTG